MAGPLSRNTRNVRLGASQVGRVMWGTYQVWPSLGSTDWHLRNSPGHTQSTYGDFLNKNFQPSGFPALDANEFGDAWFTLDSDRGGLTSFVQLTNNKDGSRTVQFGLPWAGPNNPAGGAGGYHFEPNPPNNLYPITDVRIMAPTAGTGIRVEVSVNRTLMGTGSLGFTGHPFPFGGGLTPATMTSGVVTGSPDTYFWEASSAMPIYIQEEYFFNGDSQIAKKFQPFITQNYIAEYFPFSIAHYVPPGVSTLFGWPNNYIVLGGTNTRFATGDDQFHHGIRINSTNYYHFDDLFDMPKAAPPAGRNSLRCIFQGTIPSGWPAGAEQDLFDLNVWRDPVVRPPLTVLDWGTPSSFPGDGESRTATLVSGTGNTAGLNLFLVDIGEATTDVQIKSWGGVAVGDTVRVNFVNVSIGFASDRTLVIRRDS